jgi:outer membrane lipoprotein SlyB
MKTSRKTASVMGGALAGGATGATIGSSILPGYGTAIGGAIGAVGGGIVGYLGADADEEEMKNDPEYQAAVRREKAMKAVSAALGRAFKAARPTTTSSVMRGAEIGARGGI